MIFNEFNPYSKDDFDNFNFYDLDNENFLDDSNDFYNIDTDESGIFDTINNNGFNLSQINTVIDDDFIPIMDTFTPSVIPFGNESYENKALPNTQNIQKDPNLLKDIESNDIFKYEDEMINEKDSNTSDVDKSPSNEKTNDVLENFDIYEVEKILSNIEERNPLIIQTLLSKGDSYPSMRILLRKIIILTLNYHYEK